MIQAPRHLDAPNKEAHHGRRSGVSPNRRRVTAAEYPIARLPTVKEMHLQRVATMAAATATAQQISADVDSHEQFAKELRSYRGQAAGGGQRRVTKPSWESDVGGEGTFETGYPPSGPGSAFSLPNAVASNLSVAQCKTRLSTHVQTVYSARQQFFVKMCENMCVSVCVIRAYAYIYIHKTN